MLIIVALCSVLLCNSSDQPVQLCLRLDKQVQCASTSYLHSQSASIWHLIGTAVSSRHGWLLTQVAPSCHADGAGPAAAPAQNL